MASFYLLVITNIVKRNIGCARDSLGFIRRILGTPVATASPRRNGLPYPGEGLIGVDTLQPAVKTCTS